MVFKRTTSAKMHNFRAATRRHLSIQRGAEMEVGPQGVPQTPSMPLRQNFLGKALRASVYVPIEFTGCEIEWSSFRNNIRENCTT